MSIQGRLDRIERLLAHKIGPEIPSINISYADGTTIHAVGAYEALTGVLDRGDVVNIDGDGDLAALALALTGPLQ